MPTNMQMSTVACLIIALSLPAAIIPAVNGANILVFMPMPLKSHFNGFQPMFEELAHRGHNVTVVSSFPLVNRHVANYTDIDVSPLGFQNANVMQLIDKNLVTLVMIRWYFSNLLSKLMEHDNIKKLIHSETYSFDLVMVETFLQEYTIAIGHKFNAPVINLSSATMWVSISKWLHVPSTFSYIPDCCIGVTDDMNFVERLKNTITGILEMYVENYLYLPIMKSAMNKYFTYKGWESRPPIEKMLNNVSVTLMNAHYSIGVCRPYPPGIVEVAGMHIKEPKPLPQDLQDYIDSATDGVIFFSFGSVINLSDLPKEKLDVFLNVIGRLKQRVIMKWVPHQSVKLPENIKTGSWLPQNDILAHKNVRIFITHGGLHSIEEALYNAKPVIGIPFFADQVTNMRTAEKNGFGKAISLFELTENSFGNAIVEVLSNPTFKEKAMVRSMVYRDQPMKPIDRAVYWVEYVIRNGGAKYLKSDSIGLSDTQYFLVDVSFLLIASTGLITWLCYRGAVKVSSKLISN